MAIDVGFSAASQSRIFSAAGVRCLRRRLGRWLQECLPPVVPSSAIVGWMSTWTVQSGDSRAPPARAGQRRSSVWMVPSVDRSPLFPSDARRRVAPDAPIVSSVQRAAPFFDAAERLVVETLESDHVDFERFEAQ